MIVADDNNMNLMAMKAILQQFNYTCDTSSNGKEIVETILEMKTDHDHDYKIIFMDFEMPVVDGISVRRLNGKLVNWV